MPDGTKKVVRLFAATVSVGALIYLLHLGWGQIEHAWSLHHRFDLRWIVAAVVAQLLVYATIAGMFRITLPHGTQSLSPRFLFYCAVAFLFANRALPGPAIAGVATLIYLFRGKSVSMTAAQSAAAAFYFADYAGFFALIAATSIPLFIEQPNHTIRDAYLTALSVIAIALLVMIVILLRPTSSIEQVSIAVERIGRPFSQKGSAVDLKLTTSRALTDVHRALVNAATDPKKLVAYFVLSVGMHLAEVLTVICCARAAGVLLSLRGAAASYVAGNLTAIISVLPGALGFFEAGMIGTMHFTGRISVGSATICTLMYRLMSFWAPLPIVSAVLVKVFRQGVAGVLPKAKTVSVKEVDA